MYSLNVGIGYQGMSTPAPIKVDVQVDIERLTGVDVCCDIAYLPFKNDAFENVYCFHVLEHLDKPTNGLRELIRVCSNTVEIEVPHRLGKYAKTRSCPQKHMHHSCSFKTTWFAQTLKQYCFCLRTFWDFPRSISIHVWIYPHMKREPNSRRK